MPLKSGFLPVPCRRLSNLMNIGNISSFYSRPCQTSLHPTPPVEFCIGPAVFPIRSNPATKIPAVSSLSSPPIFFVNRPFSPPDQRLVLFIPDRGFFATSSAQVYKISFAGTRILPRFCHWYHLFSFPLRISFEYYPPILLPSVDPPLCSNIPI